MTNSEIEELSTKTSPDQNKLVLRLLMTMIGMTFVALGVLAIGTEHYYGITTKRGWREIVLDGEPAIAMGFGLVCLGAAPFGVWMPTAKKLIWWMTIFFVLAGTGFASSYFLGKL